MTTVEKQLLQIFGRKKLIVEQVKKQADLFDQHLASKCILEGISPPPWLSSTSFSSVSSHPNVLKKEELISELLLPRYQPASLYPGSHHSLREKPFALVSNEVLPCYLERDGHDVNKVTDAVDGSVLSHLPTSDTCALNNVPEQDSSVTSPQECRDIQDPDNCADQSQSLVKIERSKPRQKALKTRTISAKRRAYDEHDPGICTRQNNASSTKSKLKVTDSRKKENKKDNYNCGNFSGAPCLVTSPMNELSSVSKSSDIAKVDIIRDTTDESKRQSYYGNQMSAIASPTIAADAVCATEEANVVGCSINEVASVIHSGRATSSRRSSILTGFVKEASEVVKCIHNGAEDIRSGQSTEKSSKDAHHDNRVHGLIKPSSVISCGSQAHPNLQGTDVRSIEMMSNGDFARVTRSMGSNRSHHSNESVQLDFPLSDGKEDDHNQNQLSYHVNILADLIKPTTEVPESQTAIIEDDIMRIHNPTQSINSSLQNDDVNSLRAIDVFSNVAEDADIAVADFKSSSLLRLSSLVGQDVCLTEALSTQPHSLPCAESTSIADVENCGPVPAETDTRSPGLVAPDSVTSKSNSDANTGFTSRPMSEDAVLIEPNQIHFDVMEANKASSFDVMEANKASSFDIQDENGTLSLEVSPTVRYSTCLSTEVASVGDQVHHNLLPDMTSLEAFDSQKQPMKDSSGDLVKDTVKTIEAISINSVLDQKNVVASQNPCEYSSTMGSWPQYKRIKIGDRSSYACQTPSSWNTFPIQSFIKDNEAMGSNNSTPAVEVKRQNTDNHTVPACEVSSHKLPVREDEQTLGGKGRSENTTLTLMHEQLEAPSFSCLTKLATSSSEASVSRSAKVWDPKRFVESQVSSQDSDSFYLGSAFFGGTGNIMQIENSSIGGNCKPSDYPVDSPLPADLIAPDQNLAELEKFVVETDDIVAYGARNGTSFGTLDFSNINLDHASVLEQFRNSVCLQTPLSSFSDTKRLHNTFEPKQTIPKGFLGSLNLKRHLVEDADTNKQFEASDHCLNEELCCASYESLHPYCLQSPTAHFHQDSTKPYRSPVRRFWDGIPLKSLSSEKRVSSIPDLPSIDEENENMDEVADSIHDDTIPEKAIKTVERKPLADLTEYANPPISVCEDEILEDRYSLASVSTEFSLASTCKMTKLKPGSRMSTRSRYEYASNGMVNPGVPLGSDRVRRHDGSLQNRISKPKLSRKNESRKGSTGILGKEPKRNNIVSNITSFVPLVQQQKQVTAAITGKRDIKVKALEAAEAAKQLAEKKENERRLKKEALKLERARIEEQNLRQLELEKVRKEKERKKKEAEMAAKKRQREEEQKRERERKKRRVEETKRQNMEHREKRNGNKEETKCGAADVNACKTMESKEKSAEAEHPRIGETELGSPVPRETGTEDADTHRTGMGNSGDNIKVINEACERKEKDSLASDIIPEESYTISPYKGSDDEAEFEDNDKQNTKFIPSWARRRSILLAILSQQTIDPESIFPPESFCRRDKGTKHAIIT